MAKRERDLDTALGRFLSLVLRHNPAEANIQLDAEGWADVDELLAGVAATGRSIDYEALVRVVQTDGKQRYSFNPDHTKIRANQGHSIWVDLGLQEKIPPSPLYHGTATRFLAGIEARGITPQRRQYVHLSADLETADKVGRRHGEALILLVDTGAMVADGHQFWLSENGVWLCRTVPWQYLSVLAGPGPAL